VNQNPVFTSFIARARKEYERLSPTPTEYNAFLAQTTKMWEMQPTWTGNDLASICGPSALWWQPAILPMRLSYTIAPFVGAVIAAFASRVYCFAALTGLRRGVRFNRELLYAGAMFHDMSLTSLSKKQPSGCSECRT
jgi:hypothetical protein